MFLTVKPSNIMLTEVDGRTICKLIDLSISAVEMNAREAVSQTLRTGTTSLEGMVGTPHCASALVSRHALLTPCPWLALLALLPPGSFYVGSD